MKRKGKNVGENEREVRVGYDEWLQFMKKRTFIAHSFFQTF